MFPRTWISLLTLCFLLACGWGQNPSTAVSIGSPKPDTDVGLKAVVTGTVTNLGTMKVYVLVHPLTTNLWWVQNPPSPPSRGQWRTLAYFGTSSGQGVGDIFEIVAVATRSTLAAGQTFAAIPPNSAQSDIVAVKRVR
jgi:hypothetical protein